MARSLRGSARRLNWGLRGKCSTNFVTMPSAAKVSSAFRMWTERPDRRSARYHPAGREFPYRHSKYKKEALNIGHRKGVGLPAQLESK
jgi:hypothetical protein